MDYFQRRYSDQYFQTGGRVKKLETLGGVMNQKQQKRIKLTSICFSQMKSKNLKISSQGFVKLIALLLLRFDMKLIRKLRRKNKPRLSTHSLPNNTQDKTNPLDSPGKYQSVNFYKDKITNKVRFKGRTDSERIISLYNGENEHERPQPNDEKKFDQIIYSICKIKKGYEFADFAPVLALKSPIASQFPKNSKVIPFEIKKSKFSKMQHDDKLEEHHVKDSSYELSKIKPKLVESDSGKSVSIQKNQVSEYQSEQKDQVEDPTGKIKGFDFKLQAESTVISPTTPRQTPSKRLKVRRVPTIIFNHENKRKSKFYHEFQDRSLGGNGSRNCLSRSPKNSEDLQNEKIKESPLLSEPLFKIEKRESATENFEFWNQHRNDQSSPKKMVKIKSRIPDLKDFLGSNVVSKTERIVGRKDQKNLIEKLTPICNPYQLKMKVLDAFPQSNTHRSGERSSSPIYRIKRKLTVNSNPNNYISQNSTNNKQKTDIRQEKLMRHDDFLSSRKPNIFRKNF